MAAVEKHLPLLFLAEMKPILTRAYTAFFVCIILALVSRAQSQETFRSNGLLFPIITMDKLIKYCDMDSVSFDKAMCSLDFNNEENIYTKGDLSKSKMVFGKSQDFGTSVVWISNDSTVSIMDNLFQKIAAPDNRAFAEGFSFMYRKYIITVKSSRSNFNYEEVNIIDKISYKKNQDSK